MTVVAKRFPLLREAWDTMRWTHVLLQIVLALVVFLLWAFWLQMPDANALWLMLTGMLAIVMAGLAAGGEAAILLRIAGERATAKRTLRGAAIMLLLLLLVWGWAALLAQHGDDSLRASYMNSKMPRGMRYWMSFDHLVLWQRWFWRALGWVGTGVLAAVMLPWALRDRPGRAASLALRTWGFWLVLVVATMVASMLTGALLQWTPGHGLAVESVSLVLRLAVCAVVDASVVCFVLAMIVVCVRRAGTVAEDAP